MEKIKDRSHNLILNNKFWIKLFNRLKSEE